MGEQTVVSFTAKTMRDLEAMLGRVLNAALGPVPDIAPRALPEPQPADPPAAPRVDIEPWEVFDSPRQRITAAYLDDRQQQRWVPIEEESAVPKAWRKLYRATS